MHSDELDYDLPEDRIATDPADPRDAARLMIVWRRHDRVEHHTVADLPRLEGLLNAHDLLVLNQTRVLPAHFSGHRVATGGTIGGLYLRSSDAGYWHVMLNSRGRLQVGETIRLASEPAVDLDLVRHLGGGVWEAKLRGSPKTLDVLRRIGSPPLPPYIRRRRRRMGRAEVHPEDADHYNTVFAREPGSVAAPTAALHFTEQLLDEIDARGVRRVPLTLHIGPGTFAPVRTDILENHAMHEEWMSVSAATARALGRTRREGGRIIPVGTTCVRALESLPKSILHEPCAVDCMTNLFIRPGPKLHPWRFADALMTNFHLPRSTLLALVAALPDVGIERLKRWYRIAIDEGYRFYSYGDAMLLV